MDKSANKASLSLINSPDFFTKCFSGYSEKRFMLTPVPEVEFIESGDNKKLIAGVECNGRYFCACINSPRFTATLER